MQIFKKSLAMKMEKSIFQNLMSSALFGYIQEFILRLGQNKRLAPIFQLELAPA